MANQERIIRLVNEIFAVSLKVNANYSRDQHWAYTCGILAETVLEKNYMDSIVFDQLNNKLNTIMQENKYSTRYNKNHF